MGNRILKMTLFLVLFIIVLVSIIGFIIYLFYKKCKNIDAANKERIKKLCSTEEGKKQFENEMSEHLKKTSKKTLIFSLIFFIPLGLLGVGGICCFVGELIKSDDLKNAFLQNIEMLGYLLLIGFCIWRIVEAVKWYKDDRK